MVDFHHSDNQLEIEGSVEILNGIQFVLRAIFALTPVNHSLLLHSDGPKLKLRCVIRFTEKTVIQKTESKK